MEDFAAKGISIAILFFSTLVFGWVPIWLFQRGSLTATGSPGRKLVLDILNCFSGGVFLGTCLLHLLAEGREEFEDYKLKTSFHSDFPIYETLVAVGLFLVAFVEKIGFAIMSFSIKKKEENASSNTQTESSFHGYGTLSRSDALGPSDVTSGDLGRSYQNGTFANRTSPGVENVSEQVTSPLIADQQRYITSKWRTLSTSSFKFETRKLLAPKRSRSLTSSLEVCNTANDEENDARETAEFEHHHHHHCMVASTSCQPAEFSQISVMRALLLLVALSFHTVFDGLAVGLQTTATDVLGVLTAIAIHKSLVAFCLGLELASAASSKPRRPWLFLFLFAFISPIGIGIGMGVTSGHVDNLAKLLISSILQALATGTFMYVTFFEILGQQFAHSHDVHGKTWVEMVKVLVAVVGFAAMASIKLLDKE